MDQDSTALALYLSQNSGGEGVFRKLVDNGSTIKITNDEGKTFTYTYVISTFSKSITIVNTIGDVEYTTVTNFTKEMVTSITDENGVAILTTDYDATTGEVTKYYDEEGKELILGG